MSEDNVYKQVTITGSSPNSVEEAVNRALGKASESIKHMRWFEVTEIRGNIEDGTVHAWQVTVRIGFSVE